MGETVQDQTNDQSPASRDQKDHVPRQCFGKRMKKPWIVGAVESLQKKFDAEPEQECGKSSRYSDQKRDEPEPNLTWPLFKQRAPSLTHHAGETAKFLKDRSLPGPVHRRRLFGTVGRIGLGTPVGPVPDRVPPETRYTFV